MKKQVIAIHGGNTFRTYEEYLEHLQSRIFTVYDLTKRQWRENLGDILGSEFEVLQPKMPNKNNARYSEWKLWFEKLLPLTHDGVILLGHSLGGIFLAKYLAENSFPKKIGAIMIVAAPFNTDDYTHYLGDFALPSSLENITRQSEKIFLYFSRDDKSVPFADLSKYQKALPTAVAKVFEDRGHFREETFPEIVEDIRTSFK